MGQQFSKNLNDMKSTDGKPAFEVSIFNPKVARQNLLLLARNFMGVLSSDM